MQPFGYIEPRTLDDTLRLAREHPDACFLAGGTTIVDLMKSGAMRPSVLIDINRLDVLNDVLLDDNGTLHIGALARMSDVASNDGLRREAPGLSEALLFAASGQLRNMASIGGNLLQRTRCPYFYDLVTPCNKREPGAGCSAVDGLNRMNAILGTSESCIAVHPSDMCVALAVLEATVRVTGPRGERVIALSDFHRLPGDTPQRDTNLEADELVTSVELPARGFAANYTYLKIRDRLSYAFALVSVAVGLELEGGMIKEARFALGGVAHKPWRNAQAEAALQGRAPSEAAFGAAADLVLREARGFGHNTFKIDLARRAIVRALSQAARGTPQSQSNKKIA